METIKQIRRKEPFSSRSEARKDERNRKMIRFIHDLEKHGVVARACKEIGVSRKTVYAWYKKYPWYAEAWEVAIEVSTELAEAELYRRAVEGFDRPVIYKGEITTYFKEYSDACLRLLLQSRKPDTYRDKSDIQHKHEGQVVFEWDRPIPESDSSIKQGG